MIEHWGKRNNYFLLISLRVMTVKNTRALIVFKPIGSLVKILEPVGQGLNYITVNPGLPSSN